MITCQELWTIFQESQINFFTGVPDSTFKPWMSFLNDMHGNGLENVIACNECEAVALASGYHLATEKLPVVYMQNSGFGKTVNPITSLADPEVYSIPMLLMVGWRGEPGKKDEPQHKKMGRILIPLFNSLEIPFYTLTEDKNQIKNVIESASKLAIEKSCPVAIIIKSNVISSYSATKKILNSNPLTREQAITQILSHLDGNEVIISTTGKTSRELFELRIKNNEIPRDFYTVGSMGCSASIGLGMALHSKTRIIVIDGDGAVLMNLGCLSTIGHYHPNNFYHIIIDNNSYESTGAQPTVAETVNFEQICQACGYNSTKTVNSEEELEKEIDPFITQKGPCLLVIKVKTGSRDDLGRPTTTPIENKKQFIEFHKKLNL